MFVLGMFVGIIAGGLVVAFIAGAKISERVAEAFNAGRKSTEPSDCPEEATR